MFGSRLNHRMVLVDNDLFRPSEVGNLYVFQHRVRTLHDDFAARQQSDVLQQTLALISQPRSTDSRNLHQATEILHDQSSQCFAFNILRDYQ